MTVVPNGRLREMLHLLLVILLVAYMIEGQTPSLKLPNVVVIVADDLGIGDLGCYGNDTIKTPNVDKLASEGVRLTHHLAAASLCTPSRAALLTGRYAARYGLVGDIGTPPVIVHVASSVSLPPTEITLAKALAAANYTTAAVGKWHLGSMCGLFGRGCNGPQTHGFQHFFGIPFTLTDEMRGDHPFWIFPLEESFYQGLLGAFFAGAVTLIILGAKFKYRKLVIVAAGLSMVLSSGTVWFVRTHYRFHTQKWWQVSPWMDRYMNGILMYDDNIIEQPLALDSLTQKLVNFSIRFIENHAHDETPFFLYHAFGHVHTPMFIDPSLAGKSQHGRYGDNVEEMDSAVGSIMAAISSQNLDSNTIVYFVSDHGGHLECIDGSGQRVGGHNGRFKGGKGQGSSEGAIRVPGIYRWKDHLPPSAILDDPTSLMDMMPTILDLVGLPPPNKLFPDQPKRELDGISIASQMMHSLPATSRIFLHHCRQWIHSLRLVKNKHVYKMFLKRHKYPDGSYQCGWGINELCPCSGDLIIDIDQEPLLFDLSRDPYEDHPISSNTTEYTEIVTYLKQYLADWRIRVPYPASIFHSKPDTILSLWKQPFCIHC